MAEYGGTYRMALAQYGDLAEKSRAGFFVLDNAVDLLHRVGVIAPAKRVRVSDCQRIKNYQHRIIGAVGVDGRTVEPWPLLDERVDQRRAHALPPTHVNRSGLPPPLDRPECGALDQAPPGRFNPSGERIRTPAHGRAEMMPGRYAQLRPMFVIAEGKASVE